jgi:hypothetical protein
MCTRGFCVEYIPQPASFQGLNRRWRASAAWIGGQTTHSPTTTATIGSPSPARNAAASNGARKTTASSRLVIMKFVSMLDRPTGTATARSRRTL